MEGQDFRKGGGGRLSSSGSTRLAHTTKEGALFWEEASRPCDVVVAILPWVGGSRNWGNKCTRDRGLESGAKAWFVYCGFSVCFFKSSLRVLQVDTGLGRR